MITEIDKVKMVNYYYGMLMNKFLRILFVTFFCISSSAFAHDMQAVSFLKMRNYKKAQGYCLSLTKASAQQEACALLIVRHAIKHHAYNALEKEFICLCLSFQTINTLKEHVLHALHGTFKPLFYIPYFKNYLHNHMCVLSENETLGRFYDFPEVLKVLYQAIDFTAQETQKGNIILFHGQAAQWAFFQNIYREILSIKTNRVLSDDFIALRFNQKTNLNSAHVYDLRTNGVTNYNQDRFNIFFTAATPFQNGKGSNPYTYLVYNSDQSTKAGRYAGSIETIFEDNGMKREFDLLVKNNPILFDELEALYEAANKECGDHGNLIALSLPKKLADKLCYPTESGGPVRPATINGKEETNISEIIKHYDQTGKWLEFALILAPEILDPFKAQKAGVIMKYFGPMITNNTKKYQEFKNKLAEIMDLARYYYVLRTKN